MSNRYSVIVFDLGNVLIPFDYSVFLNKLDAIEPGLGKIFYDKYMENYDIHQRFERWEISNSEFLATVLEWLDNKVDEDRFCEIYSDIFTENRKLTGMLPKLKREYKLVLLSNTNDIHRRFGWGGYEFLNNFDKLILSHEVGAIKPERKIYEAVMNYTQCPPQDHIFIDDVKEYAEGALKLGWDAIHFTGNEALFEQFIAKGIEL